MNYLQLAYLQGMNKAAQEFGFASYENFQKEAGVPWRSMISNGVTGGLVGMPLGAAIGGIHGAYTGDPDKSLLERAGPGALKGGLIGGAALGTLGAVAPLALQRYTQSIDSNNNNPKDYPVLVKLLEKQDNLNSLFHGHNSADKEFDNFIPSDW